MDEAVDGRRRRHRVLEDAVPLAEDQVARDEHRPALVALRHQGEEHLDLLGGLLHVADVVEDEQVEMIELAQCTRQFKLALGREEVLHEAEGRREEDAPPLLDERVPDGARRVGLAAAGQPEGQPVDGAVTEVAGGELAESLGERRGQAVGLQGGEGLAGRQS